MRIAWEEPFGPVIPVIRVKNIDDAIDHCNSNNLALQVRTTYVNLVHLVRLSSFVMRYLFCCVVPLWKRRVHSVA